MRPKDRPAEPRGVEGAKDSSGWSVHGKDELGKGPRDEPMLRHEWLRAFFLENFFRAARAHSS